MPLNLWGFAAVTVPLVAMPGASTAVVLRNSLAGGVRSGVATAVGANTGSVCYGLLSAFGVAVVLQRWPMVWVVVRGAGTAYLVWLGIRSLRLAFTYPGTVAPGPGGTGQSSWVRSLREGFLTNLLNPSLATFYASSCAPARRAPRRGAGDRRSRGRGRQKDAWRGSS